MKNNMNKILIKITQTSRSWGIVPLRIIVGVTFLGHGSQKLFGWFGGYGLEGTAGFFQDQLGLVPGMFWAFLAASGEFLGGLFLMAGFLARLQGAVLAVTMLVAITTVHHSAFFLPTGMEFALTLFAASLVFVFCGAGNASIDYYLNHKKE